MGLYYTLVWLFYEACITSSPKGARNIQECEKRQEEARTNPSVSPGIMPELPIVFDLILTK